MDFSLYKNTYLNSVSEDTRNAVLKALKIPLEEYISDTKQSVELINSLVDYISFLEWIFLEDGQYFTKEDFKTPWLSSLLITSNRHDEKEKREILEFFKDQFKEFYPDIFKLWARFETVFGFDNPASILIDAAYSVEVLNVLEEFYLEDKIKNQDITNEKFIECFSNSLLIWRKINAFDKICEFLWRKNTLEDFLKYKNSKVLSVFTFDQDEDFVLDSIKICLDWLKKIDSFDFEWIFEVNIFNLRRWWNYNNLIECINYFWIKSANDLLSKWVEELLKTEEYNSQMIYFESWKTVFWEKEEFLVLDKYEWWFWRNFTFEEAENWTLKNIFTIYSWIKNYDINLGTVRIIFDYLDKYKVWIWTLKELEINNFIVFCRWFLVVKINKWNIEEKIEILKELTWINIDLEWILDKDLFKLLEFIIWNSKEINYWNIDTKEVLYKPFFANFSKFVWVNEKWEKYSENWDKKHFKEEKWEIKWILQQSQSVEFINLFSDEFEDISDVLINQNFQLFYQNAWNEVKKSIVNFIKFVRKYNLFEIKLEDITQDLINFCGKNFTKDSSNKVASNLNIPQDFFDEKLSLKDFENFLLKSLILKNSKAFENLKLICELYNLPVKLSSFKEIYNNYVDKYQDTEWFFNFFPVDILTETTKFIVSRFPKDLTIENLIYILISQYELILDIWMHHLNFVYEKEQLLKEKFKLDTNSYFKKDEGWNYIFNVNKKDLLKFIFDNDIYLEKLENFLNTFSWVSLWKLVNFYKAEWFKYYYKRKLAIKFLIQYSLNKNDFKYLMDNVSVMNIEKNNIYVLLNHFEKLWVLLDKTWWFLTEKFVLEFVLWDCSETELDEMIADYEKFRNILSSGWTLDWTEDNHWLISFVVKDVYPEREYSANIDDYKDKTNHLKSYKFDRNGYHINLTWWVSYTLVWELDEKIVKIYKELLERLSKINSLEDLEEYLEKKAKENNITFETSSLESSILEYYKNLEVYTKKLQIQDLDIILAYQILISNQTLKLSNNPFEDITKMMEEFWDKFKETLSSLVKKVSNDDSRKINHTQVNINSKKYKQTRDAILRTYNIFSKTPQEARNIWKLKKLAQNNLKAFFDENTLNDILTEIETKIDINNLWTLEGFSIILLEIIESKSKLDFWRIALEWAKYYSKLEQELTKFEKKIEEWSNWKQRQLDMYFMKTKESSRARWVAWNCAWTHEKMWENENYFEIVLFDWDLKQCIWVVELLVMKDKKWKYLLYWPTPRETYLEKVDPEELYHKITEVVILFAQENWFDGILTDITHWRMWNATWKFAEVFQKSVKKVRRISLLKEYNLFWWYNFKDNLEIVWEE